MQTTIDPVTGWIIDPTTGWPINPGTGLPQNPATITVAGSSAVVAPGCSCTGGFDFKGMCIFLLVLLAIIFFIKEIMA